MQKTLRCDESALASCFDHGKNDWMICHLTSFDVISQRELTKPILHSERKMKRKLTEDVGRRKTRADRGELCRRY